ncbi:MAG: peptidase MA family metallohydrolase [Bacillota bacterium]|jgi:hypothetical protein
MKRGFFCPPKSIFRILINVVILGLLVLAGLSFKYPNLPKVLVYKAFREYARFSMTWKTRHWQELSGEKFILRFQPGDENVAKMVLDTAEEAFVPVNQSLKYTPYEKVPIVLYPDTVSLNRSFGWAANESAMGVYWAGVIRILSPNHWITAGEMTERFKSEGPMSHEYAHFIVDYIAQGNYPRWLTEGIAQRVERKITGYEMELKGTEEIYQLVQMDADFDLLPNQSAAYRQSLAMVDFLVKKYGEDALYQILLALGKGKSLDRAFEENMGVNTKEFETQFLQSLTKRT